MYIHDCVCAYVCLCVCGWVWVSVCCLYIHTRTTHISLKTLYTIIIKDYSLLTISLFFLEINSTCFASLFFFPCLYFLLLLLSFFFILHYFFYLSLSFFSHILFLYFVFIPSPFSFSLYSSSPFLSSILP